MRVYKPKKLHPLTGYVVRHHLRERRVTDVGFCIQSVLEHAKQRTSKKVILKSSLDNK